MTKPTRTDALTGNVPPPGEGATPKMPHERDESHSDVDSEPRASIKQAKADIDSGKQATDRGEATDAAYQKQKE